MATPDEIGDRVRRLREGKNMTQAELGARIGLSQTSVAQIETGVTINPRRGTLRKLCNFFDVTEEYLLHGTKPVKAPFFPSGKVNKYGATEMPAGSIPDLDMGDANPDQPTIKGSGPATQSDREFIDTLLAKIKRESARADQAEARETKLYAVVHEQAGTIRFLQEQVNDLQLELRGKEIGNQAFAPGTNNETPRAIIRGLRSYDFPEEVLTQCVVRSISSAPKRRDFCFGESNDVAA